MIGGLVLNYMNFDDVFAKKGHLPSFYKNGGHVIQMRFLHP